MKHKGIRIILLLASMCLALLVIAGCAHQPQLPLPALPGFWKGVLHGIIAPASFVASLFTDVRIYEYPNSGRWYDLGFMLGIGGFGGGLFGIFRSRS